MTKRTDSIAAKKQQPAQKDPELYRTLWHIFPGFITISLYTWCPIWLAFLVLIPFTVFVGLLDGARLMNPELGTIIKKSLPPGILRERERHTMSGSFWYLIGVELVLGTSSIMFKRDDKAIINTAVLSILYLAWCDPIASFVGRRVPGIRPACLHGKSLEGCLAAALMGSGITAVFLRVPNWWACPVVWKGGLIAAASEAAHFGGGIDDNLVIPVMSSVLLRIFTSRTEMLGF